MTSQSYGTDLQNSVISQIRQLCESNHRRERHDGVMGNTLPSHLSVCRLMSWLDLK